MELPGIAKEDIHVERTNDALVIAGERKEKEEPDGNTKQYCQRERPYGLFQRTLALPAELEWRKITANFKDGILGVILPKHRVKKPSLAKQSIM